MEEEVAKEKVEEKEQKYNILWDVFPGMDEKEEIVEEIDVAQNDYNLYSKRVVTSCTTRSTSSPTKKNTTISKPTNSSPKMEMNYNVVEYLKKTKPNCETY